MNQYLYDFAITQAMRDLPGAVRLARNASLRAIGATESDLQHTVSHGIPPVAIALFSLALGAVLGIRYLPENWQHKIRHFGE